MICRSGRHPSRLLAFLLSTSMLLGSCAVVEEPATVTPRLTFSLDVPGEVWSVPELAVSPEGQYSLACMTDDGGAHMVLLRMNPNEPSLIRTESVGRGWLQQAFFSYRPIGWVSDTRFLYARVGWQPSGSMENQRCVVLVVGDSSGGSPEEVASIPLPTGGADFLFVPNRCKVLINLKTSIWEYDVVQRSLRLVRDGLPDTPYFSPVPSPSGEYFVYAREDEGRRGLYILDTATGEERLLTAHGETRSFYPSWSFDGKYIAAYTVERNPGSTGTTWRDYGILEGEDTAQAVGHSITVFDTLGSVVSSVKVEGKRLASFIWGATPTTLLS